ncbi:hypothetical protein [Campylobacter cuniculorum]|uniref:Uncharacterized protein n=2 Tax=Campylobacter cuniculorum TaxID=374106 RepID=A0A1W6BWV7_9BACT|nr:hypothetical protein [Campylobacter cuniculorum]ARJ56593.1 hypothetical protein CCUN_0988 [Campylobacter cuniculorum DSM 23162 = LMG 24588]QOR04071.1 hypothetical protein A0071_07875 [Campylobacter cuniculorum]
MISLQNNIKQANYIKRALSFWNFELAEQSLKQLNEEQKGLKEYFEFLFETGNFEKFDLNALKDLNLNETKMGGGFKQELETLLQKDYKELKINDFRIGLRGAIACYLVRKYTQEQRLNLELANSLFEIILKEPSLLSKSFFMKTIIDYFNVLDDKNFFQWHNIVKYLYLLQTTLNGYKTSEFYIELAHSQLKKILNLNPKPKQNPKIAVLITGQLRGDWEYILQKNIKNLIKPLNADMFLFSWDEVALWPGLRGTNTWVYRNFPVLCSAVPKELELNSNLIKIFPNTFETLKQVKKSKEELKKLKNYDFKGILLEDDKNFENNYAELYLHKIAARESYGWNKALKLMQDYEMQHNFKYDYVFRIRPDREHKIPEKYCLIKDNEIMIDGGVLGAGGEGILGPRGAIIKFFKLFQYEEFNFINNYCRFLGGIHGLYYFWMLFNGLKMNYITRMTYTVDEKLTFPDISKELQLDFEKLKQDGVSEEKLKDYRDFFELVCEYYKIEPEQRQNCISQHPCFLRLKEKKVKINSQQNSGAVLRVKNHLAYKLGNIMVSNNPKTFKEYKNTILRLIQAAKEHQIQREQQKGIKLPPLETLKDYEEALKIKNYFSYRLGEALIKAFKNIYFGGMIKFFFFDIKRIKKEFHKKQS